MKKLLSSVLLALVVTVTACHAQIPTPTKQKVVELGWIIPSAAGSWKGCTAANPCVFLISAAVVATPTAACPDPNTSAAYALVGTSTSNATTFTDNKIAPGTSECYTTETQQSDGNTPPTSLISGPSNTVLATTPALPLAPSLSPATTAENVPPILRPNTLPEVSSDIPTVVLTAKLVRP